MFQKRTTPTQAPITLEVLERNNNNFHDDTSSTCNSDLQDQSGKALLWRYKIRGYLSSSIIGKKKAYRNRILLATIIIIILGGIAAL
jgi:hypothetical protein